jgi:hypothetical protein
MWSPADSWQTPLSSSRRLPAIRHLCNLAPQNGSNKFCEFHVDESISHDLAGSDFKDRGTDEAENCPLGCTRRLVNILITGSRPTNT